VTLPIAAVLIILSLSFILFISGVLKPDLVAILTLIMLVLTGLIKPAQAFAGFSSYAVITIAALMIIGEGL
jgi:di/tricarboxylate transporter